MTTVTGDLQEDGQGGETTTRIVIPPQEQPEDWISTFAGTLSLSSGYLTARALRDLPFALGSLFDLATATRAEEHLSMLTVNADGTVTLSHHHRATGSSSTGTKRINAFVVLAVIGKEPSSPLLQMHTPGDSAFEAVAATTPSDQRLLKAAKSTYPHAFDSLQLFTTPEQTSQPSDLQDVQTKVKSFIFVPPFITLKLLNAPTYMSPRHAAELIVQTTVGASGSDDDEEIIAGSLLRWLWCAQMGMLKVTSFIFPDSKMASCVAEDFKHSYLGPIPAGKSDARNSTTKIKEFSMQSQVITHMDEQLAQVRDQLKAMNDLNDLTQKVAALESKLGASEAVDELTQKVSTLGEAVNELTQKVAQIDPLKVNTRVKALWKGGSTFYPGVIVKVHPDGNTFDVQYDDGCFDQVQRERIAVR